MERGSLLTKPGTHRPDRFPEGAGVLSLWALWESPCLEAPPADTAALPPSLLLAPHLRQGRNGLEAHALLGTGGRPAAGPPAALGAFRLPALLPLQQEGSRQVPGQLGAGPFCIPTRTAPPEPRGLGFAESQPWTGATPVNVNWSLPGMRPQKSPTFPTLPALLCAAFPASPLPLPPPPR